MRKKTATLSALDVTSFNDNSQRFAVNCSKKMSFVPRYNTIVNVQNVGDDMTNEKLYEMFAKFGTVKSYKLMNNPYAEFPRFAYVAFEDSDAAEEAIIEMNGKKINDNFNSERLRVRRTHKKHPSRPKPMPRQENATKLEGKPKNPSDGLTIFVKNFDHTIDSETLRRIFGRFGAISYAKVIIENGHSKGYGFVTFTCPEAATNAVREKNGKKFLGDKILHVALARGKDPNKESCTFASQRHPQTYAGRPVLTAGLWRRNDGLFDRYREVAAARMRIQRQLGGLRGFGLNI